MRFSFVLPLCYLVVLLLAGFELRFYTILNDFWGTLFLGEHLSLSDPRTLHNGFFPIGYPGVIRLILSDGILIRAYLLSAAASAASLLIVTRFVERQTASTAVAAACGIVLAIHPLFFLYGITTGPDAPTLMLATSGLLVLVSTCVSGPQRSFVLAGVLLGAAGLLRQHGFPFAFASLAGTALVFPMHARGTALAASGTVAMLGIQVGVNLTAGVGPFESAQAFNIYKLFNPVDWFHLDQLKYPANPIDVIKLGPDRFLQAWWLGLRPTLWLGVPPVMAALLAGGQHRRIAVALSVLTFLYLPIQAIGGSPRGPLLVLPCSAIGLALAIHGISGRLSSVRFGRWSAVGLVAAAVVTGGWKWIPENLANVRTSRATADLWLAAEHALRADGVRMSAQVFTDSFDFYFTSVRSSRTWDYRPRNTGGWAQIDLYGYDRVHPPLDTSSFRAFIQSCQSLGVTHLVLLSTAGLVVPELGAIQAGGPLPPGLRHVADLPGIRIVAVSDGRRPG